MKILKKKQIKSITNQKTQKMKENISKKRISKSAALTPKHCKSSKKTVLKQNFVAKDSFVYEESKKNETK